LEKNRAAHSHVNLRVEFIDSIFEMLRSISEVVLATFYVARILKLQL